MTENVAGVGKRTVASGLVIGAANIYAVWASQIYRADDSPLFRRGNSINIAFCSVAILLWLWQKWNYVRTNKNRAITYQALNAQGRQLVHDRLEVNGSRSLLFK